MLLVLLDLTIVVVFSVVSALGAGKAPNAADTASACGRLEDDDWASKAAAMAMAPLMPVPATRQITVE